MNNSNEAELYTDAPKTDSNGHNTHGCAPGNSVGQGSGSNGQNGEPRDCEEVESTDGPMGARASSSPSGHPGVRARGWRRPPPQAAGLVQPVGGSRQGCSSRLLRLRGWTPAKGRCPAGPQTPGPGSQAEDSGVTVCSWQGGGVCSMGEKLPVEPRPEPAGKRHENEKRRSKILWPDPGCSHHQPAAQRAEKRRGTASLPPGLWLQTAASRVQKRLSQHANKEKT